MRLPAPRLQLRWEKHQSGRHQWRCFYELVIRLDEYDIRRESEGTEDLPRETWPRELIVQMGGATSRDGNHVPCTSVDGTRYADSPFRDGAHARWDAKQLGDLPVYVIAPDGTAFPVEKDPA